MATVRLFLVPPEPRPQTHVHVTHACSRLASLSNTRSARAPRLRYGTGPFTTPLLVHPGAPPRGPKFCHTREAPRRGTHALPPSPIHLSRPPTSRLWAIAAARTRRTLTVNRSEIWMRPFAWHHLHLSCWSAAQLLRMGAAFGAMPRMRDVEPDLAPTIALMLTGCCLDFMPRFFGARDLSRPLAF